MPRSVKELKDTIYPLILNNTNVVSGQPNKFIYNFPAGGVRFQDSKIAIGDLSLYYSWFNITADYNNNAFSFIWPTSTGTTTYNITIPDGAYTVSQLNSYLQNEMIDNGLYLLDANGDYVYYIELQENPTYYAVQLNCFSLPTSLPTSYSNPAGMTFPATTLCPQVVIPSSSIVDLLGFSAGTYPSSPQTTDQSFLSDQTPQVSPVQSIIVSCNLVNNRYSIPSTSLYTFNASGTQFGGLISASPNEYFFVDIQSGVYQSIEIEFLDQNFRQLQIRDTNVTTTLLILNQGIAF
jgi:hypothetical protein